jgi:hypothetical protein
VTSEGTLSTISDLVPLWFYFLAYYLSVFIRDQKSRLTIATVVSAREAFCVPLIMWLQLPVFFSETVGMLYASLI